jgi:hypothetical protein
MRIYLNVKTRIGTPAVRNIWTFLLLKIWKTVMYVIIQKLTQIKLNYGFFFCWNNCHKK